MICFGEGENSAVQQGKHNIQYQRYRISGKDQKDSKLIGPGEECDVMIAKNR
jgi:hypothetical protein